MPHIHELFDFTVTVFIVYKDTCLLVHHPRYGQWIPVGGHVELDEDPDQALLREIAEETGLEVEILCDKPKFSSARAKPLYTPNYMDVHEANPPHKHISLTYFARATHNNHAMSDEHSDMRWFSVADLEDQKYALYTELKFYCKEAIKKASQP
jgi:8-oxo-dGTP diphosphatase